MKMAYALITSAAIGVITATAGIKFTDWQLYALLLCNVITAIGAQL